MNAYLGSIVRTSLAALGGYLVLKNIIPRELLEAFITTNTAFLVGLITWLSTQGWSLFRASKKQ